MKSKLLLLLPIASIALTSCEEVKSYKEHLDDYVVNMQYRDNFHILQLSDIHWGNNTSVQSSKQYLTKLFKVVSEHVDKIDLVELTGDLFMLANTYHIDNFVSFFDEQAKLYNFKYAVIWGNHDHHGLHNPNYLTDKFLSSNYAILIDPNDDLYGRSNYVINLTEDGTNATDTVWQIANLDSGASFSETSISPFRDYDYIREDQTEWWLAEHNKVGKDVPTIAYYHIPQDENGKAFDEIANGATYKNKFFKLEEFGDAAKEEYASNFIDVASQNNLKAAFMAHAHAVDWTVDYMGVTIGLGVKTGEELYFAHIKADTQDENMKKGLESVGINEDFDLIGASLVTIDDKDGNFTLEHCYYNERTNGDFLRWVNY